MYKKEIIEIIELLISTPEHSSKYYEVIERARKLIEKLKDKLV